MCAPLKMVTTQQPPIWRPERAPKKECLWWEHLWVSQRLTCSDCPGILHACSGSWKASHGASGKMLARLWWSIILTNTSFVGISACRRRNQKEKLMTLWKCTVPNQRMPDSTNIGTRSDLPSGWRISQLDVKREPQLGEQTCFIPDVRHECLSDRWCQSWARREQQALCGSRSLSTGQNRMLAHESIWSGTSDRSTSLQKLQSNALERTFLSSCNPKTHAEATSLSSVWEPLSVSSSRNLSESFTIPLRKCSS